AGASRVGTPLSMAQGHLEGSAAVARSESIDVVNPECARRDAPLARRRRQVALPGGTPHEPAHAARNRVRRRTLSVRCEQSGGGKISRIAPQKANWFLA